MVKIIFSDFDNTMLNYYSDNNYFDDYKIDVLKKVCDKGIKFCIITGRGVPFFKRFPNLLEVVDYILGSNGACIYDVKNDKYIYHDVIKEDVFEKIIKYLLNNGCSFILNCQDKRYKFGNWDTFDCLDYHSQGKYSCEHIYFKVTDDQLRQLNDYIKDIDNVKINNMTYWNNYWTIDLNNKFVSKGNSALWLCDLLGINMDEVIAFGDGDNDLSMFEVVDKCVAVENASDKVKQIAHEVSLSCENNGIYKYIEDHILK